MIVAYEISMCTTDVDTRAHIQLDSLKNHSWDKKTHWWYYYALGDFEYIAIYSEAPGHGWVSK